MFQRVKQKRRSAGSPANLGPIGPPAAAGTDLACASELWAAGQDSEDQLRHRRGVQQGSGGTPLKQTLLSRSSAKRTSKLTEHFKLTILTLRGKRRLCSRRVRLAVGRHVAALRELCTVCVSPTIRADQRNFLTYLRMRVEIENNNSKTQKK